MPEPTAVRVVIPSAWMAWFVYWLASAFNVKRSRWRAPLGAELAYRLPLMAAIVLLFNRDLIPALSTRLWPQQTTLADAGAAMVLAGLLFTVVARIHLGR